MLDWTEVESKAAALTYRDIQICILPQAAAETTPVSIRNEKQRKYRLPYHWKSPQGNIWKNVHETMRPSTQLLHLLSLLYIRMYFFYFKTLSRFAARMVIHNTNIQISRLHPNMLNHMTEDNIPGKGHSYEQEYGAHRDQKSLFPFLLSVQTSCDQPKPPHSCQLSHLHCEDNIGYLLSKIFAGHKSPH